MNSLLTKAFLDHTIQQLIPPKPPRSSHSLLCLHLSKKTAPPNSMSPIVLPSPCCQACPLSALKDAFSLQKSLEPAQWGISPSCQGTSTVMGNPCQRSSQYPGFLCPLAATGQALLQTLTGVCTPQRSDSRLLSELNSCSFLLITVLVSPHVAPPLPAAGSPHSSCLTPNPWAISLLPA